MLFEKGKVAFSLRTFYDPKTLLEDFYISLFSQNLSQHLISATKYQIELIDFCLNINLAARPFGWN